MQFTLLLIILSLFLPASVSPEAIFDVTMNPETTGQTLSGEYVVNQSDGRLVGDNLFHSFSHFSIDNGESATFFSSIQVKNIISRVTGNNISQIDGPLKSYIIGSDKNSPANFYLINPNGIVFGPKARLETDGSFYGLTCDYMIMDNGQNFDVHAETPNLSMASPYAFGFLNEPAGSIVMNGGNKHLELKVTKNQRISLFASGIDIKKSYLNAEKGQIYIASISGACKIIPTTSGYENMDTIDRGPISVTNDSELNVSGRDYGDASGDIFIMGGHVHFNVSYIEARTEGKQNGGITLINASSVIFEEMVRIYSDNISHPGDPASLNDYYGGNVLIHATGEVLLSNNSCIETGAAASTGERDHLCHAGSVEIKADSISLLMGSSISSHSSNAGNTGNIELNANKKIQISTKSILFSNSFQYDENGSISQDIKDKNTNANISLDADNIYFFDKGGIASQTTNYGDGGDILLNARKSIYMDSGSLSSYCQTSKNHSQTIIQGKAGDINIKAASLFMTNDSEMIASTRDQRQGGSIQIDLSDSMHMDQSHIFSESTALDGGAAGKISIHAGDSIHLLKNSALTTEAINADDNESLGKGEIIATAKNDIIIVDSKITSSVLGGKDNAGNIDTFADTIVMNRSQIIAKADQGRGGNIHIVAGQFVQSAESIVDASSNKGIDGDVTIDSPEMNASSGIATMPTDMLNAQQWMRTPCDARSSENISRFVVQGLDASPTSLDDLWPSPPAKFDKIDIHISDCKHCKNKTLDPNIDQLFSKGNQYYQTGQFNEAANIIRKILAIPQESLSETIHFYALTFLNRTLCALGYHQEVVAAYEIFLPRIQSSSHDHLAALFYNDMGDLYLSMRDLPKARKYLNLAYQKAKSMKDPLIIANTLNNYANLRLVENRLNGAIKRYQKALSLIKDRPNEFLLKSTLSLNLVFAYIESNIKNEWLNAVNSCLSYIQQLPEIHDKAALFIALSLRIRDIQTRLEMPRQDLTQLAIQLLEQALVLSEDLNDHRLLSLVHGYMGKIFEDENEYDQAFQYTRQAIFIAQEYHFPEIQYLWEWQLGRLFIQTAQKNAAYMSFNNAMKTLKPIRHKLFIGIRGHEHVFSQKVRPIYLGMANLLMEKADSESIELSRKNYLNQAINTMETLKQAEIQDYFDDECLVSIQKSGTGIGRIPSNTAILYPVPFPDHLSILLVLPDGINHFRIPVNGKKLRETVNHFRHLLEDWDGVEEWKDEWFGHLHEGLESAEIMRPSQNLYDWIIQPIEDTLTTANIDTLLIAPDGVLRLIPLSALNDGAFFLIEKYALVTIPAISLTDMQQITRQKENVLLAGLSEERHGAMPLTFVKKELDGVNAILPGEILMNENFSLSNLTQKFKTNKYTIVHLATHGVFGGSPDSTYLLTYDRKLTMNQLEELIHLTKLNQNNIDFLALSACQTAQGNERAAFGLAGIALKAGAKSALATLWTVDDRAASRVLIHFYEQFSYQQTKAGALQSAMKQLIDDTHFCHPSYWAPFLLIGNWR